MQQGEELLLIKILKFILAIFIPIMMKLTKYYDKLVIKKELEKLYQTEDDVNILAEKWLSKIVLFNSEEIDKRRQECFKCEYWNQPKTGSFGRCSECKCLIKWKTRVAFESCPKGKWNAIDTSKKEGKNGITATC